MGRNPYIFGAQRAHSVAAAYRGARCAAVDSRPQVAPPTPTHNREPYDTLLYKLHPGRAPAATTCRLVRASRGLGGAVGPSRLSPRAFFA